MKAVRPFLPRPFTRLTSAICAFVACSIAMPTACKDQSGGGLLGSLDPSGNPDPNAFNPLALPTASAPTGPAAAASRAIHDWIRAALAGQVRIALSNSDAARTILVDLPGAPALPDGVSLIWSFGDGAVRSGTSSQHTYAAAGTFPVIAALSHRLAGLVQYDSTQAVVGDSVAGVSAPPEIPVAAVAVVDPIAGVAPLDVSFDGTLSSAGSGSSLTYAWSFGDGTQSSEAKGSHTYTASGVFIVTLQVTNNLGNAAVSQLVVTVDSATVSTPPTPPPTAPAPTRAFNGLVPDGWYKLSGGIAGAIAYRDSAIAAMAPLGRYGFKRWATMSYMGVARSLPDATEYFAPLIQASHATGVKFIPGFWLHHIIDNLYGVPNEPPWNVTDPLYDIHHPMNPRAVLEQAFWDEVVTRSTILAQGAQSNQVFIDGESVFWYYQDDPLWTSEANLQNIRGMIREAVRQLQSRNIFLILYHPALNPSLPVMAHTTRTLLLPDNASDPLAQIEHWVPNPYYSSANYPVPDPPFVDRMYTDAGFTLDHVCYGFTAGSVPGLNLIGFTAAQYDAYCRAWPGIADKTWFYCNPAVYPSIAQDFGALPP